MQPIIYKKQQFLDSATINKYAKVTREVIIMKFCDKLVKQRKNNNMSQEQLADKLGVSRQAISKWESGSTIPDMAKILELCKILNCNLEDLIDDGINSNVNWLIIIKVTPANIDK